MPRNEYMVKITPWKRPSSGSLQRGEDALLQLSLPHSRQNALAEHITVHALANWATIVLGLLSR